MRRCAGAADGAGPSELGTAPVAPRSARGSRDESRGGGVRARSRAEATSGVRNPRHAHVDAHSPERHALGFEQRTLAGSLREGAVGAHHAMPWDAGVVAVVQDRAGHARSPRRNVAVAADEADRYRPDAREDLVLPQGWHPTEINQPAPRVDRVAPAESPITHPGSGGPRFPRGESPPAGGVARAREPD